MFPSRFNPTPLQRIAAEHKAAGLTRRQIAPRMGVSPGAIKKLWWRARKRALKSVDPTSARRLAAALKSSSRRLIRRPCMSLLPTDNV